MLHDLELYYRERCDGTWEHRYGFTIESCDNPGWIINIKDPHLFKIVHSLIESNDIPVSVDICIRDKKLSEFIIFSEHLCILSNFVKYLLARR